MQTGNISMQSENMFPIIKKFLYSDNEIFLRELVSNAVDATKKLQALTSMGKAACTLGDITIEIKIDEKNKRLIISDKGIGMTAEEVEKYINNVAFSGANEFLEKYKGIEANSLIGHFGLGFYSAFMVADKVEIITRSYLPDAVPVKWTCNGNTEYTIEETTKEDRGTDIILYLAEDAMEFLQEIRLLNILVKYCKFLPVPVRFGNEKKWEKAEGKDKDVEIEVPRIINDTNPIWKVAPSELTKENYEKFYRELYPYSFEQPLFNIHINIDYPFDLTGILYFPKIKQQVDFQKNKIQLYCNQVYITDQLEGIVPEFLMLLQGVIDSPDIPLNVSRSYLQSDSNVKKISAHITKKVADKLEEMFSKDREDFQSKWDDIRMFMVYGVLTDEKFYERAKKFLLFKNTDGTYFTIEEYQKHIEVLQKDKNDELVILYATNSKEHYTQIESAKAKGYDVLLMDGALDMHYINLLEQTLEKIKFVRVDSEVTDKLIEKGDNFVTKLTEEEQKELKTVFENATDKNKFSVLLENLSDTDAPVSITHPEFIRRWADMQKVTGNASGFGMDIQKNNLVINTNHPVMEKILKETDEEKKSVLVSQLIDLSLLSQQMLTGESLAAFVKRSLELLN
ncbi:MAG: molecular chaperone HtpG [Bacteroidales bacterium]|jgi:molecular chaperone HtpG|nr:molecular chaperone HtpG [Bacteroidales bacterium]